MTGFSRTDASALSKWWRSVDLLSLLACGLLLAIGLVLSLASGPAAAERIGYDDPFFLFWRHVVFAGMAVLVLIGMSMLNRVWARRTGIVLFLAGAVLMAALPIIGHEVNGAQRWLRFFGLSLQPSEIVKPGLVVTTAWILAQRQGHRDDPWIGMALGCFGLVAALLLIQPDIGQTVLLSAVFMIVFFVSGLPWRWAWRLLLAAIIMAVIIYQTVPHVRYRIGSFLAPDAYDTYQTDTARAALTRGGHWGLGPGEGRVKSDLPDAHTDFIYAVAGEEFGLVMCLLILVLYALISITGIWHCSSCRDDCSRSAGVGLFALFGLQASINIGINLGLLPSKGLSLPLISYGGSSLMGMAICLGLGLALARGALAPRFAVEVRGTSRQDALC